MGSSRHAQTRKGGCARTAAPRGPAGEPPPGRVLLGRGPRGVPRARPGRVRKVRREGPRLVSRDEPRPRDRGAGRGGVPRARVLRRARPVHAHGKLPRAVARAPLAGTLRIEPDGRPSCSGGVAVRRAEPRARGAGASALAVSVVERGVPRRQARGRPARHRRGRLVRGAGARVGRVPRGAGRGGIPRTGEAGAVSGRPLGGLEFVRGLERSLGRELSRGRVGRPRRSER